MTTHTRNLTLRPMVLAVNADIKDDEKGQLAQSNMTMRADTFKHACTSRSRSELQFAIQPICIELKLVQSC